MTARQETGRSDTSHTINFNNSSMNNSNSNLYISTLNNLDGAFDRRSQKDLLAASLPPKAEQQLRWVAIGNHKCAQQSEGWAGSLRRERDRIAVGGGGFQGLDALT
jgi:hypothetical protein